jgi:SAM-dependent methyltransferase
VTRDADMTEYFSGRKLYGNDFTLKQLEIWYESEKEGYAGEVLSRNESYAYKYHALNAYYGFPYLKARKDISALGLGSAYGQEFAPIRGRLKHITILDPSDQFAKTTSIDGVPVTYRRPVIDGSMEFADATFDLITCFGVLHHIANVSKVLSECHRTLAPGGLMLCREPIVTQGDWRRPRAGMTKNERGIPLALFKAMVSESGFVTERASLFDFSPFGRIMHGVGVPTFANGLTTRIDRMLSLIFSFNTRYHRVRTIEKLGPASLYLVLRKT